MTTLQDRPNSALLVIDVQTGVVADAHDRHLVIGSDSFEATTLEQELAARKVGRLVVTGAQTDFCVRWTLHGALGRGYDTVLVADAHTTDDLSPHGLPPAETLIAHTNMFWAGQGNPGRSTDVSTADEITF